MIDPTGGDPEVLTVAMMMAQTPNGLRLRISELEVQLAREKDMYEASMRNVTALGGQLAAERKMRRLIEAQHVRLCDEVYEEDGETLKIVAERKAREDADGIAQACERRAEAAKRRVAEEQSQKQYLRERLAPAAEHEPNAVAPQVETKPDDYLQPFIAQAKLCEKYMQAKREALRLEGMEEAAKFLNAQFWAGAREIRAEIARRKAEGEEAGGTS